MPKHTEIANNYSIAFGGNKPNRYFIFVQCLLILVLGHTSHHNRHDGRAHRAREGHQ